MEGEAHHPFGGAATVAQEGEERLIACLRDWLGPATPAYPRGMGDDCAVIPGAGHGVCIHSCDSLTYGHHFDQSVSPAQAGAKLAHRNLSDIAAMGGYPDHALLALLLGPDLRVDWLRDFVGGLSAACLRYSLQLVGGDISALPPGQFSAVLTVTGHLEHAPLLRRGAQVGDAIFVTGQLGGSIEGHHYQFVPRLAEGQWLARSGLVSSCMDLTDGLAKDLPALLPRGSAASLDLDHIPLSPSAQAAAKRTGQSALHHAFGDGEDYELLFTLKASADARAFAASWEAAFPQTPLSQIATITQGREGHSFIDAATGEAMFFHGGFKQWKTDA